MHLVQGVCSNWICILYWMQNLDLDWYVGVDLSLVEVCTLLSAPSFPSSISLSPQSSTSARTCTHSGSLLPQNLPQRHLPPSKMRSSSGSALEWPLPETCCISTTLSIHYQTLSAGCNWAQHTLEDWLQECPATANQQHNFSVQLIRRSPFSYPTHARWSCMHGRLSRDMGRHTLHQQWQLQFGSINRRQNELAVHWDSIEPWQI